MLGKFFNCKTKISYVKSSDTKLEYMIFQLSELEFHKRLNFVTDQNTAELQQAPVGNQLNFFKRSMSKQFNQNATANANPNANPEVKIIFFL